MADAGFLQFLAYFAKLPPSERPSALENIVGVPPHMVASELPKFERMAAQQGHELSGGFSAAGGEAGEEGGAAGPLDSGPVSYARVRPRARSFASRANHHSLFTLSTPPHAFFFPCADMGGHKGADMGVGRSGAVLGRRAADLVFDKGAEGAELGVAGVAGFEGALFFRLDT